MKKTLFVLYKNLSSAYDAAQDLQSHGFKPGNVRFFTSHDTTASDVTVPHGSNFGALVGALTGLLLVWRFIVIPGTGTIGAAGPLPALIGGIIGVGVGILVGAFIGGVIAVAMHAALSTNRSNTQEIHPGNALLTVSLSPDVIDEAVSILVRYHPVDVRYSNVEADGANHRHPDRLRRIAAR